MNSLAYFIYSLVSLTVHHKQSTDPSLDAWGIQSESQNQPDKWYTEHGNHADPQSSGRWPFAVQDADYPSKPSQWLSTEKDSDVFSKSSLNSESEDSHMSGHYQRTSLFPRGAQSPGQASRTFADQEDPDFEYNSKSGVWPFAEQDPDYPPTPSQYSESDDSYMSGQYQRTSLFPRGAQSPGQASFDFDQLSHAENYPSVSNVEADELSQAEQYSSVNRGQLNSDDCPDEDACLSSCKRQGYKMGVCSGRDKERCHCYRFVGSI